MAGPGRSERRQQKSGQRKTIGLLGYYAMRGRVKELRKRDAGITIATDHVDARSSTVIEAVEKLLRDAKISSSRRGQVATLMKKRSRITIISAPTIKR